MTAGKRCLLESDEGNVYVAGGGGTAGAVRRAEHQGTSQAAQETGCI